MNSYRTIYQSDPLSQRLVELARHRSTVEDDPIAEAYLALVEANSGLETLLKESD